ncbi:putative molibdopterin-dependent oxidoreductase YjgC [Actinophytocola algeriensis]|uniref:Putative molibdopterin-dependent oxidoreductase YjgC n=1 Tax=Actinophytocola algeriensis TaxID=1768010 RepID=A0A7W7QFU6_9PSEU|nr:putative molibdopterin-dependent oxidoreductase YjgC [Actinophytocola algeriensis]MBE1473603.1 putative molibdopterin-dependent oxidoreductase YjgC [Actinophytocola algeriensis]
MFPTDPTVCEAFGHDLITGGAVEPDRYKAMRPNGRAFLKAAPYLPLPEGPDDEHPLLATSGRTAYHFHTRTKTGRSRRLHRAAPGPWVELSAHDAAELGVTEGDVVRVTSPRGTVEAPARIGRGRDGVVFLPFHFGYWDTAGEDHTRAANELTITEWDPVSKQPLFKLAAVRVEKVADGRSPAPAPTTTASAPADGSAVPPTRGDDDVREDIDVAEPPESPPTPGHVPNVPQPATREA